VGSRLGRWRCGGIVDGGIVDGGIVGGGIVDGGIVDVGIVDGGVERLEGTVTRRGVRDATVRVRVGAKLASPERAAEPSAAVAVSDARRVATRREGEGRDDADER
jgi:hypothetical protein